MAGPVLQLILLNICCPGSPGVVLSLEVLCIMYVALMSSPNKLGWTMTIKNKYVWFAKYKKCCGKVTVYVIKIYSAEPDKRKAHLKQSILV